MDGPNSAWQKEKFGAPSCKGFLSTDMKGGFFSVSTGGSSKAPLYLRKTNGPVKGIGIRRKLKVGRLGG